MFTVTIIIIFTFLLLIFAYVFPVTEFGYSVDICN